MRVVVELSTRALVVPNRTGIASGPVLSKHWHVSFQIKFFLVAVTSASSSDVTAIPFNDFKKRRNGFEELGMYSVSYRHTSAACVLVLKDLFDLRLSSGNF